MTSPYLDRDLRTESQARRDLATPPALVRRARDRIDRMLRAERLHRCAPCAENGTTSERANELGALSAMLTQALKGMEA